MVNPSVPANSVQELVAYAKANPGKVNFSSGGIGVLPHLIGEMFKARAGIDIVHVPYKGGGPSINDVVAGNVQMTFEGTSVLLPLIQAGRLRALAVTTPKRIPQLPDVPTMVESGFPNFVSTSWTGLLAPAHTPQPIIEKLNAAINDGLKTPELKTALERLSNAPLGGTPADFTDGDQGRSRQMVADRQDARARQAMIRRMRFARPARRCCCFAARCRCAAQNYPDRPVKIIVPTVAAGTVDLVTRVMANDLGTALGKQFFIENRSGAGNTLGSRDVAHSDPDGYTLLMSSASGQVISPLIYKDPGYDPLKSFAPIAPYAEGSVILVVNPALPFQSVADLVAYAKANPGQAQLWLRRNGDGAAPDGGIVQVGRRRRDGARALSRRRAVHPGRHCRQSAIDLRGLEPAAAAYRGRPVARARRAQRQADCRNCPTCRPSARPVIRACWRRAGPGCSRPPAPTRRSCKSSTPRSTQACRPTRPGRRWPGSAMCPRAARRQDLTDLMVADIKKWTPIVQALHLEPQ